MKKILLTLLAGTTLSAAGAQSADPAQITLNGLPRCGFNQVTDRTHTSYLELLQAYRATAAANPYSTAAKGTGVVYDIPVVFHIVYSAASINIPDSVVADQISVLNKAFRKQHADTASARSFFKPLSGDAEIQFHLATTDPQGNPTSGITRTLTTRGYFGSGMGDMDSLERIKSTAAGGIDPWPVSRYLNIWVGNLANAQGQLSVLGYGVPPLNPLPGNWPAGADAELAGIKDGVVLQTHSVGSNSVLNASLQGIYTKGRAAVHEVGHYLGLQHVFGSNGAGAPDCGVIADDGIGDTPTQNGPSFDQNSGTSCPPATKNTCGATTSGDLPDMWEDYMDYAHDACQVLFTHDQITVMRNVLANQRNGLVNPSANGVTTVTNPAAIGLYPNPARNQLSLRGKGNITQIEIRNMLGQPMLRLQGAAAMTKQYDISALPGGSYILLMNMDGRQAAARFSVIR